MRGLNVTRPLVGGSGSQVSNFFNGLNGNASSEPNRRLNYNGL